MQVKKFEAQTMKEALEMVKAELGPEAIILNAKDHRSGFGLVAKGSVEVTAAVSEMQLKKKKIVESRIPDGKRSSFSGASARVQRNFINRSIEAKIQSQISVGQNRPTRYIDIEDDETAENIISKTPVATAEVARARVQNAAAAAARAGMKSFAAPAPQPPQAMTAMRSRASVASQNAAASQSQVVRSGGAGATSAISNTTSAIAKPNPAQNTEPAEVHVLKNEIRELKSLVEAMKDSSNNRSIPGELTAIYEKLHRAGVNDDSIFHILEAARKELNLVQIHNRHLVEAWAAKYILNDVQVVTNPYEGRLHIFVGPSGQGKTATLVKMASHLVIREKKKIAILTTDSFKVGASDQLKIYAQILNVPFGIIRNRKDWAAYLDQLTSVDMILVDSPGFTLRNSDETDFFQRLMPPDEVTRTTHYVLSVLSKDVDAMEMANRYRALNFNDVIFTDLDESASHGLIYNFQKAFQVPLHSFGVGPLIPEDFEPATRERVLDLLFKITNWRSENRRGEVNV